MKKNRNDREKNQNNLNNY